MEHFTPYSPAHAVVVASCAVICATLWRAAANARREATVRRWWVRGILLVQSLNVLYFATIDPLDWAAALPLQVCDLMGWVAAWSLTTDRRLPRTMLVFAGLLLCGQAFITPTLTQGPATLRFWLFFACHLQIVASAFYELVIRGYTPGMLDAAKAWVVMFVYALLMVPLNLATGWNYGYVGPDRPGAFTAIDVLGPWPFRLVIMGAVLAVAFPLLVLIVRTAARLLARRSPDTPSTLST